MSIIKSIVEKLKLKEIFAIVFILFVSGIDKKYIFVAIALIAILVPVIYMNLPEHA